MSENKEGWVQPAPAEGVDYQVPIEQVEPRLRLGAMIRRLRALNEISLEAVSQVIGVSVQALLQVENGNMPLSVVQLRQIATMANVNDPSGAALTAEILIAAATDFQAALWGTGPSVKGTEVTGDARMIAVMPPEQLFVEYREGWIAGACGRPEPGDMSPEWARGHADGATARDTALHQRRLDLDLPGDQW